MRRALSHPSFMIGLVLTGFIVTIALLSLFWTPHDPGKMQILQRLRPPSVQFWLGTDQFGRDIASMLMVGARNALLVGIVAVGIGFVVGMMLGVFAAQHEGSLLDEILMRLLDFTFAFPAVLSAILILTFLGPGVVNAVIAIGIYSVPIFARLARGAALQVFSRDFIRAARLAGCSRLSILRRHVLPNIAGLMIRRACNSPSRSSPKPGFPISASAPSRPIHPGGACCSMPRPIWRARRWWRCFRAWRSPWRRWPSTCSATGCAIFSIRA